MAWRQLVPNVTCKMWYGPYSELRPPTEKPFDGYQETELSVQPCGDDGEPDGPVYRFPMETTLREVWTALADHRK